MAKTVFSPSEVAHVWASQSLERGTARATDGDSWRGGGSGRCPNGSAYFEGRELYSYGRHYLTGFILVPHGGGTQGVVVLNSRKNSVTTNRRRREAEGATSHYRQFFVPDIEDIREPLADASRGEWSRRYRARDLDGVWREMSASEMVAAHLQKAVHAADSDVTDPITDEAASYLLNYTGGKGAQWRRLKAAADKKREGDAARAAKLAHESKVREARNIAALPDDEWRAIWPADVLSSNHHARKKADDYSKRLGGLLRAARIAKIAKGPLAVLTARVKEYRTHLAGMEERARAAEVAKLRAAYERYKEGGSLGFAAWQYRQWGLNAEADDIERLQIERERATRAAAFALWQSDPENATRPPLSHYEKGSREYQIIDAQETAEREALAIAYLAWKRDPATVEPPAARLFNTGPLRVRFPEAWQELTTAERAAKEAKERADALAQFEAWRKGLAFRVPAAFYSDEKGGAYIRRSPDGSELETSQGARVPWEHAVKAFRFIKLCRALGREWRRNGKTVRVGHYQIDSISAEGDFRAGCHFFRWPEIERLAREQGVFEDDASAEAEQSTGH